MAVASLIVTLLWPLVSNLYGRNSYGVPEACARVGGSGDQVCYEFFSPRMLCSTVSGGDEWLTETDPRLTLILSVVPASTDSAQSVPPASGDVELWLTPELPFVELPEVPSTALTAIELEAQFAAFVAQTTARFGPAFEEPVRQGDIPGPALDLTVATAPYAFDCLGTGIGYGMELTFSGADADDWDDNYDAAEAA